MTDLAHHSTRFAIRLGARLLRSRADLDPLSPTASPHPGRQAWGERIGFDRLPETPVVTEAVKVPEGHLFGYRCRQCGAREYWLADHRDLPGLRACADVGTQSRRSDRLADVMDTNCRPHLKTFVENHRSCSTTLALPSLDADKSRFVGDVLTEVEGDLALGPLPPRFCLLGAEGRRLVVPVPAPESDSDQARQQYCSKIEARKQALRDWMRRQEFSPRLAVSVQEAWLGPMDEDTPRPSDNPDAREVVAVGIGTPDAAAITVAPLQRNRVGARELPDLDQLTLEAPEASNRPRGLFARRISS